MLHPAGSGRRRAAALGNEVPHAATETTEAAASQTTEAATAASRRIVGTLTHSRRAVALIAARIAPHQDLSMRNFVAPAFLFAYFLALIAAALVLWWWL